MRAKRPLRKTGPSFDLPQLKSHVPEVQVQQKNEQELNKFFIDIDDNTVSPMVTTDPSFRCASVSNLNSLADLTSLDSAAGYDKSIHAQTPASSSNALGNGGGPSPNLAGQQGEAKFIHVNNTNIFVLIDGISMFVEGKSTFTGTEDARLLTERLRQKKQATRSVDTVQEAILNIEMSNDGCVREVMSPLSATSHSGGNHMTNCDVGAVQLPLPFPTRSPPSPLLESKAFSIAPEWASLFETAKRPVGSPLFRTAKAKALASLRSCARASVPNDGAATAATTASPTAAGASVHSSGTAVTPTSAVSLTTGFHNVPGKLPHSTSSPSLRHHDSSSSLLSMASGRVPRHGASHSGSNGARKVKPISAEDIGHSNRSLDMDEVVIEELIGKGTQGTVFRVRVDGKVYALKCMNIDEAINATNDVERQGRKKGLVKELTMISLQRSRPPPEYMMQMFNAVASLDVEQKQLSILMELMSFTVENIQQMVSRIPKEELMGIAQSTFRKYMAGDAAAKQLMLDRRADQAQYGSPRHSLGRSAYNEPAAWERQVERETPLPEVFLSMLAHDVLKGLNELHTDYSIIHCDLKPANVLLRYDQRKFKLADFGCGCVMEDKQHVERRGIDLGSMLYKAPERFAASILHRDADTDDTFGVSGGEAVVEFTAKADVWSLGIMLLELASGIHPCEQFKSDFWNYGNLLKLSKMNKPLNWSEPFYDFILRTVCVDVSQRWSVTQLLKHPFIVNFNHVPREKLMQFVQRVDADSKSFHKRQQSELLKEQILLSTTRRHRDTYRLQSEKKWSNFTAYLKRGPPTMDQKIFPQLRHN
ncbi:protein kinase [Lotmaria passim]